MTGRDDFDRREHGPRRLYRDTEHAVCCGVCAGIADYFGFDRGATRVLTVLLQFLFAPTFLVYLALSFLLPRKPRDLYRDAGEEAFWRQVRTSPKATTAAVRHKMREMDVRLQRMERYVTSPNFDLEREFQKLEED
jgi:phage shock protein C